MNVGDPESLVSSPAAATAACPRSTRIRLRAARTRAERLTTGAGDATGDRTPIVGPIPLSRSIYRATVTSRIASQRPTTDGRGSPDRSLHAAGPVNPRGIRRGVDVTRGGNEITRYSPSRRTNGRSINRRAWFTGHRLIMDTDTALRILISWSRGCA